MTVHNKLGIKSEKLFPSPKIEISPENKMFLTCNFSPIHRGHYLAAVQAARLMVPAKQGLIVNISSAGGLVHFATVPYCIGKSGVSQAMDPLHCCLLILPHHIIAIISPHLRCFTTVPSAQPRPGKNREDGKLIAGKLCDLEGKNKEIHK